MIRISIIANYVVLYPPISFAVDHINIVNQRQIVIFQLNCFIRIILQIIDNKGMLIILRYQFSGIGISLKSKEFVRFLSERFAHPSPLSELSDKNGQFDLR